MRLLALLLLLVACPAVAAASDVGPPPGLRTDKLAITLTNADGDSLAFWGRRGDDLYVIFSEFRLGGGRPFGSEMPTYQVDDGDPLELEWMRERDSWGREKRDKWGNVEATRIWWVEWAYLENVVRSGMVLRSLLKAKEIAITYRAADGAGRTARFSLSGVESALVAATGLKIED